MKEYNFYRVERDYLEYLHLFDNKVPVKEKRPFIAVLIDLSGKQYAVPITSKTRRQNGKKRNSETTTELRNNKGVEFGAILYNNMIPVNDNVIIPIVFSEENSVNKISLENKYKIIKGLKNKIKVKANNIYIKRTENPSEFFINFCCDFKLLEEKSKNYKF